MNYESPEVNSTGSPVGVVWKPDLYTLQSEAPKPNVVQCSSMIEGCPPYYGLNYHGPIKHNEAENLLKNEGSYLIRISPDSDNYYTLSLRICGKVRHYKLFYEDGQHYVLKKRLFDTVEELVAHGIVTKYIETKAGPYIQLMHNVISYEKSPYMTLNRLKRATLRRSQRNKTIRKPDSIVVDYNKPHLFKSHTFRGFYWCEFCGNFLWGFIAQGVKCDDCGFSAHYRCSEKVPADCCPDLRYLRGVFGIDLTTLVKAHKTTIPFIVDKCIKEIENRGLLTEGLYRVSGYQEEMDSLRLVFDKDGENADISVEMYDNINVVASILKLYFRLLPIPLITYDVHPMLVKTVGKVERWDQISEIKKTLCQLPPSHYNTLKFLMEHLHKVTKYSERNKMTAQNLSTVFAPSIMPPPDLKNLGNKIPDICSEIAVVQLLITHQQLIFDMMEASSQQSSNKTHALQRHSHC